VTWGPVGSVARPDDEREFERLEGDGFTVFVHRKVLEEALDRDALRFHFGAWGWCRALLAGSPEGE
jgi:hypothetical protein